MTMRKERGLTAVSALLLFWAFTDGWLFVGWCELRKDFRAFRRDRISLIEETGEHFANDSDKNLATYLSTKLLVAHNS